MPIKIPSFTDALPLTLGEKRPTPNSIKPSEEWDLIHHDSRGALWKNCVGGRLQFIPNPNSLGPRKAPGKIPPPLQQALDSVGKALKPPPGFKPGDYVRYKHFNDETINFLIGRVTKIKDKSVWCLWSDKNFSGPPAHALARGLLPCDAEGWIPHTPGDPMPCDEDLKVEIKIRAEATGEKAWRSDPCPAYFWNWGANICRSIQILAWKPAL